jgi:Calcineurin-like phosphoesterase
MKLNHLLKALCVALVLAFGGSLANGAPEAGPTPSRDWVSHPAVVQVDKRSVTIFAIGDVHADPERLIGVLKAAGIISPETPINVEPKDVKWTFRSEFGVPAVLVMTGDMIDKGPKPGGSSLRVIAILRALQTSAVASDAQVIILMGNHEAEFLADPNGSKTADFASELRTVNIDPATVANCQGDLGQFLCNLPIAAKVKDWFFSHAGNTNGRTIAALSADIEAGFASRGFATPELIDDNSILEARLNDNKPGRQVWIDKPINGAKNPQALLTDYANKLGVKHMVQGHQPGEVDFGNGVTREADAVFQGYGLLFLIDTGMSRGVDGSKSAGGAIRITFGESIVSGPLIHDTEATVMCANGQEKRLWKNSVPNPESVAQKCGINKP